MEKAIWADLQASYGLIPRAIEPVTGGWMNRKWKASTEAGDVLIKQFSRERFGPEKLEAVEAALQRQMAVAQMGVRCPAILPYKGHAIRLLEDGTAYMVMAFCPGRPEHPDTVTETQMRSLGSACARMHRAFARLPAQSVKGYPLCGGQILDGLWANWEARMQADASAVPAEYLRAVRAQEPILRQLNTAFFDRLPQAIAHEDFAADNILFDARGVTAIVDFDRNQFSYRWHDIGRALLSLALKGDRMDLALVHAFLEGYARHLALTFPDIADALRLSWCIEALWWIQPRFFQDNHAQVRRFQEEILWLTGRWFEIDALLGCEPRD